MFHRLDSSSLRSRGWPCTLAPLASSSPVLGSQVCAPVPGSSILHSFKLQTPPHPLELKSGVLSSISWKEYGHLEFSLSHLFNYLYQYEFMHSCSIVQVTIHILIDFVVQMVPVFFGDFFCLFRGIIFVLLLLFCVSVGSQGSYLVLFSLPFTF